MALTPRGKRLLCPMLSWSRYILSRHKHQHGRIQLTPSFNDFNPRQHDDREHLEVNNHPRHLNYNHSRLRLQPRDANDPSVGLVLDPRRRVALLPQLPPGPPHGAGRHRPAGQLPDGRAIQHHRRAARLQHRDGRRPALPERRGPDGQDAEGARDHVRDHKEHVRHLRILRRHRHLGRPGRGAPQHCGVLCVPWQICHGRECALYQYWGVFVPDAEWVL